MKVLVTVKPNSKKTTAEKLEDGSFLVHLRSAPIDGKTNNELIRMLSKYFHVTQASIVIARGATGKKKMIEMLEK